jgi:hypothetical protein
VDQTLDAYVCLDYLAGGDDDEGEVHRQLDGKEGFDHGKPELRLVRMELHLGFPIRLMGVKSRRYLIILRMSWSRVAIVSLRLSSRLSNLLLSFETPPNLPSPGSLPLSVPEPALSSALPDPFVLGQACPYL